MATTVALIMRRVAQGLAALLVIAILALGVGFAVFVAIVHQAPGPTPKADGIVALTGGAERVETALHLLEAGNGRRLLVSGVAHGAGLHDLARRADLDPAALAPLVTLGRSATTTWGNAEETADWAREFDLHSLLVVTGDYHMPRAMLEMRRAMPSVTLYAVPVKPQASPARLLVGEYGKLLAAWLGLSHLIHHPLAFVHHTPVDNSVNG